MSESLNRIPISKVKRASKLISTGAKVGGNYIKHYAQAAINGKVDQEGLDKDNAEDIYDSLSELKGSALKMAQMLSMDQNVLPKAYSEKFAMAQYSVPPLSFPLVKKTIKNNLKHYPHELFDSFSKDAVNAASMGQVHKAQKGGTTYAVKVQYPGVADSIKSDLKLAKPLALQIMKVKSKDVEPYFKEVEAKLLEEADYGLELKQSLEFVDKCSKFDDLVFPQYDAGLSARQVLTMTWVEGEPLGEWMKRAQDVDVRNKLGQALWDFYMYQMHEMRMMHADPHPGNFLVTKENKLGVIDFGCIKYIPDDFYKAYFALADSTIFQDVNEVTQLYYQLEILKSEDSEADKSLVYDLFTGLIQLLSQPFNQKEFDFGDSRFFEEIYKMSELIQKDERLKSLQARGSTHFIYFNRTFFGLYHILSALKAKVKTKK